MPTHTAITADEHINTIRGAAPTYMKGFADLTHRGHVLLAIMRQHGMIEEGQNDHAKIWQVQAYEPEVRTGTDTTRKVFENHNAYVDCQVDVREYEASDLLTEAQYKKNRGRNQLINLYDQKMKNLGTAMVRRLQEWIYRDGDSAAYLDGFQGFESALADDGNTVVADKIALPSDTYAGRSTAVANLGGTWTADLGTVLNAQLSTDWPYGQGNSNYDYFSPLLVNWGSSSWTTAGSWEDNCNDVLRFSSTVMRSRNGYMNAEGLPLINMLAPNLYEQAENFFDDRFRIIHPFTMGDLGFPNKTMKLDGTVITCDYACPADTGYGICPAHIEAFFLETLNNGGEESFIDTFGPTWEEAFAAFLFRVTVFGNLRLQPKFMVKYSNYADA